jgi:hypothetical protein
MSVKIDISAQPEEKCLSVNLFSEYVRNIYGCNREK